MKYKATHLATLISISLLITAGCSTLAPPVPVTGTKVVVKYMDNSATAIKPSVKETSPPSINIKTPSVSRGVNVVGKKSSISVTGVASSKSGISIVYINGQETGLDENGNFWSDVLLKVGENTITVTATGVNKITKTETFTVVREPSASAPQHAANEEFSPTLSTGRYYALIVGINAYRYIDKLNTAINDSKSLATILEQKYGFEITTVLDQAATRERILNELNNLRSKLKPNDSLLIYYAGHGYHDKVADASYWLPVDAMLDNDTYWLDSKSITDQLKRIPSRHVLIIADSCYSGTITRGVDPAFKTSDTRDSYLNKMQGKAARVLMSSGGNEPVADSGGNGHSIFSEVLINALSKPDKHVFTAEELHVMHIKESVAGRAEQTPEYKVIRNSGHDGGDFIFKRIN